MGPHATPHSLRYCTHSALVRLWKASVKITLRAGRLATRALTVANRGSFARSGFPIASHNRRHMISLPAQRLNDPSLVWYTPNGDASGWWLPATPGGVPVSKYI